MRDSHVRFAMALVIASPFAVVLTLVGLNLFTR